VVGCDDSALAARTLPTLTSLRQPIGWLADRAIDLLTAKLTNPAWRPTSWNDPSSSSERLLCHLISMFAKSPDEAA
jgi:DNA-binding LacI/PurR family transcriptional regulator